MFKKIIKAYDYPILITVVALCLFGLVMVYSSSMVWAVMRYGYDPDFFYRKQRTALILGLLAMTFFMFFPYKIFSKPKFLMSMMLGMCFVLLLVFMIGHTAGNAQSWFKVGIFALQPAEFSKLVMIIYIAAMYGKRQKKINQIDKAVLPPIVFLVVICFLIAIQPDFGTAAIIFTIALTMIMSCGMSIKNFMKLFGFVAIIVVAIVLLFVITGNGDLIFTTKRLDRFTVLLNPFDPVRAQKESYQLVNSLIAIGSGGIWGLGLGNSNQKYGYLPESHTDYIMAIIAEELGLFGVLFVILSLGFIVLRGLRLAMKCKDPFGSLLLIGISSMIGIQTFAIVGGISGIIPLTGVPLPFISYGGSSLILLLISIGIMQNVIAIMNLQEDKRATKPSDVSRQA